MSGGVAAGVVEVALLSAGADIGGVDDAATLTVVDADAASVEVTEVDDAATVVDVAPTWARTGLTTATPIVDAIISAAPINLVMFAVILLSFLSNKADNRNMAKDW